MQDRTLLEELAQDLDAGEAEAIVLAIERADVGSVLLDDRDARRLAEERGLDVAGSEVSWYWRRIKA